MKVALFGGSFNPIHKGHLLIARELINKKVADEVWLIPCGNHAFNKELLPAEHRLNMMRLALKKSDKVRLVEIETRSKKTSFTSETVKKLRNEFREHDFYEVIGSDNLPTLDRWRNFDYLKNEVRFILATRPGFETIKSKVKLAHIVEIKSDISSTKIRSLLKEGKQATGLLPNEVEDYITKEDLYNARPL